MAWTKVRANTTYKLTESGPDGERKEERLIFAQRVPVLMHRRSQLGHAVALVLGDIAVLPNIKRVDVMTGELRREGIVAVLPIRPDKGLWTPDPSIQGDAAPEMVEGPSSHPYVDTCLRDWRLPHEQAGRFTIGRADRQLRGATIGVEQPNQDFQVAVISANNAVTIARYENRIALPLDNSAAPLYMLRQGLWEPAPEVGPTGLPITLTQNIIPYGKVVDNLEADDQARVNTFYGNSWFNWRRAWKRHQLKQAGKAWPEVASPWIGSSTAMVISR